MSHWCLSPHSDRLWMLQIPASTPPPRACRNIYYSLFLPQTLTAPNSSLFFSFSLYLSLHLHFSLKILSSTPTCVRINTPSTVHYDLSLSLSFSPSPSLFISLLLSFSLLLSLSLYLSHSISLSLFLSLSLSITLFLYHLTVLYHWEIRTSPTDNLITRLVFLTKMRKYICFVSLPKMEPIIIYCMSLYVWIPSAPGWPCL